MPQTPLCQPLLLGGIQEALLHLPDKAPHTGLGTTGGGQQIRAGTCKAEVQQQGNLIRREGDQVLLVLMDDLHGVHRHRFYRKHADAPLRHTESGHQRTETSAGGSVSYSSEILYATRSSSFNLQNPHPVISPADKH